MGGLNGVFDSYAGVIVDLKKNSVILYYRDGISKKKRKHSTSVEAFRADPKYRSLPNSLPSPLDNTFRLLPSYRLVEQTKNAKQIEGCRSDATLYMDESGILKQEVLDTKEIRIKRDLLKLVFMDLPDEIHFLLESNLRTTVSDAGEDSAVSERQTRAMNSFLRGLRQDDLSNEGAKETAPRGLLNNKWVSRGLDVLKMGVDLSVHITTTVSGASTKKVPRERERLSLTDFEEVAKIDDFIESLPREGSGGLDD